MNWPRRAIIRVSILVCLASVCLFKPSHVPAAELSVVDGDTIRIGATTYRLHGIDAPEKAQTCPRAGVEWLCGQEAAKYLRALTASGSIVCSPQDRDRYGRVIAVCRSGEIELNREMVRSGLAWAFRRYSNDYIADEQQAREHRLGVWNSEAIPPWEWRRQKRAQ
jgi:endonuclease YncB( thermonuclease family)